MDEIARRVQRAVAAVPQVRLAYLFGSRAHGAARPDSDLDIAVVIESEAHEATVRELTAALAGELGAVGERVDLLELDRAGSSVAFRVIRDGQCLIDRDPGRRVRLEARIARRYDDDAPVRDLFRRTAVRVGRELGEAARGRR